MPVQKDYSKYIFNGELLGKGRMVLAVIKKYVSDHPDVTYKALKKVFPDSLQAESEIQFTETQVVFSKLDDIKPGEIAAVLSLKEEGVALVKMVIPSKQVVEKDTGICARLERVLMNKGTYPSIWKKNKRES